MISSRALLSLSAVTLQVLALSLDGKPLKELMIDHGNGTVMHWTAKDSPDVALFNVDLVPAGGRQSSSQAPQRIRSSRDLVPRSETTLKNTFCSADKSALPDNLYSDTALRFCGDVSAITDFYYSSVISVFRHERCVTSDDEPFDCSFLHSLVEQNPNSVLGTVAKDFCNGAFDAIEGACGLAFGGADVDTTDEGRAMRSVEYRSSASPDRDLGCESIANPLPGRPFKCENHSS